MPKLPSITPKKLLKKLQKEGFRKLRQKGSHIILFHPEKKKFVTLPIHVKDLKKGLLSAILKEAGILL